MAYKMYLMSISGLDEKYLQKDAMCLLDSDRREYVHKYKNEKDRMRAIVAGLLLQVGFMELEPELSFSKKITENIFILENKKCIDYLTRLSVKMEGIFPFSLEYGKGVHGKPFWEKELLQKRLKAEIWTKKKFWHFNLSHSGEYVVLVVADTEVGVDIQEAREVKYFPGGYEAFSRMEAFVKCTGEGYANGHSKYKEKDGYVPGYELYSIKMIDSYALNICFKLNDKYGMEKL